MLLTLVSAILVVLAFPKAGLWPLAFVGLAPLFLALARTRSWPRAFGLGFLYGALVAAGMGYWLVHAIAVEYEKPLWTALVFVPLLVAVPWGIVNGLFAAAFRALHRPGLLFAALAAPALWTLMEYSKEAWTMITPWGVLGTAMVPFSPFLQTAGLWGMYGLTFVLALANGAVFSAVEKRRKGARLRSLAPEALLAALAVAAPTAYGLAVLARDEPPPDIPAVVVQGNFSQRERWSGMSITNRVAHYLSRSGCPEPGAPCVVVWPETELNSPDAVNDRMFSSILAALPPRTLLVAGGLREDRKDRTYNCAYMLSGDGTLAWYDKHILLPYGEKSGVFDLLGDFYTAPASFCPGVSPRAVPTFLGSVGAGICLEILYPDHVRRSVLEGAEVLVNLSNDAWFGDSPMPWMSLDAARLRAVENRRWLLRASVSGISAVISPTGEVKAKTPLFQAARATGRIRMLEEKSLYTRLGDWPLAVSLVFVALGLFLRARGGAAMRKSEP